MSEEASKISGVIATPEDSETFDTSEVPFWGGETHPGDKTVRKRRQKMSTAPMNFMMIPVVKSDFLLF
ncbi:MAG TPA: hypothetical protein VMW63_04500 [Methanoregulaceae archaeon]|nr:hypothetical protein [Methanoregulaceae archaeon]